MRAGGGSGLTENSVELGLKWLSARQDAATGAIGGVEETSLALLAFLGAGYTDRGSAAENKYAKCVRAGLRSVMQSQDEGGCFADRSQPGWLRAHTMATIAMCEAFWMTRNPRYKRPAQEGLDLLASVRTLGGGWGDGTRKGEDDLVATVSAALAMRSGKLAGLEIDPDALEATRALLERRKGSLSPVEQAAALAGRILLGEDPRTSGAIRSLADLLLARLPEWRDGEAPPVELWHLGTLGMFQVGGKHWRQWNDAMVTALVESQHPKDAGDLAGAWTHAGAPLPVGDVAKLAACLEVYYRYDRVFGVR